MTPLHYLVGPPGCGKSTAMRTALEGSILIGAEKNGLIVYERRTIGDRPITVLGRYNPGAFPGTDTLSMAVAPKAAQWVLTEPDEIWGEGDRLATYGFLAAAATVRPVTVWNLNCPEAWERSCQRAVDQGTKLQDHKWWTGRLTKTLNLLDRLTGVPNITIVPGPFNP